MEDNFEFKEVGRDYEDCFRQISLATGGGTVFSNNVEEAIIEATQTEDFYYLLTFTPTENSTLKPLGIDVRVNREKTEVIHTQQVIQEKIQPITIADFDSSKKTIKFSLTHYQRVQMEDRLSGAAEVKITLLDKESNTVFEDAKVLQLIKDQTHISIPFKQLKSGSYIITIQAVDRITGRMDIFSKLINF
jgi:hypothetical protein